MGGSLSSIKDVGADGVFCRESSRTTRRSCMLSGHRAKSYGKRQVWLGLRAQLLLFLIFFRSFLETFPLYWANCRFFERRGLSPFAGSCRGGRPSLCSMHMKEPIIPEEILVLKRAEAALILRVAGYETRVLVDLERGMLTVRQAIVEGILVTPKSDRERDVPLSAVVRAALGRLPDRTGYVFAREGTPLTYSAACNILWTPLETAALRHIGWHVLRHTFASHLVMAGCPLLVVKELCGHSTVRVTERYAHLAPSMHVDAIQFLANALDQTAGRRVEPEQVQSKAMLLSGGSDSRLPSLNNGCDAAAPESPEDLTAEILAS